MDQKRALSSVDIRALVTELRGYTGAKVDKAYLYGEDLVRLKLRDFDRGRVELLVEVGDPKRAHVTAPEHVPDAPERPPDFARKLRNRIAGADLVRVEQYEFDRIIRFEFDRDDARTIVIAELFGDGNVAVLNQDLEVIAALETVRLKSRTVAPGAQYEFPASRLDPLGADYDTFVEKMKQSDTDLVRTLATQLNVGGFWGEELCTRGGVEKARTIADSGAAEYEALYTEIDRLADRLKRGELDPRLYRKDGHPVDVAPVPLAERESLESDAFDSFNEALDEYFTAIDEEEDTAGDHERPDFAAEIAKYERIIDQQEGAIEKFDREAKAARKSAELLYANYDLVDEVLSVVRGAREDDRSWEDIAERFATGRERGITAAEAVIDVDAAAGTVTVKLDDQRIEVDPSMGVEKNADQLYTEAKQIEEKKAGAQEAIEASREELADVHRRREQWAEGGGDTDESDAADEPDTEIEWVSRTSIPIRREDHWYERFRWFHTSDDFLVIGGRSADQNEELVKKYMEPGDRFFHAQAHGGPVTILKATGPSEPSREVDIPKSTRTEAAQFAVSYSSVWKEGKFAGDVYEVSPSQVSKTPESGEYLEKGGFAVRGDRKYHEDTPVGVAVAISCEPETRVVGGPPSAIEERSAASIRIEPGRYAQNDIAKMLYRAFRERFADETFVRKIASPDQIQEFCPPGGSRIVDE